MAEPCPTIVHKGNKGTHIEVDISIKCLEEEHQICDFSFITQRKQVEGC